MTAVVIDFTAFRTARVLQRHAPPPWVADFLDQMKRQARERGDDERVLFWERVAAHLGGETAARDTAGQLNSASISF